MNDLEWAAERERERFAVATAERKAELRESELTAELAKLRAEVLQLRANLAELSEPVVPEGWRLQNDAGMWALYDGNDRIMLALSYRQSIRIGNPLIPRSYDEVPYAAVNALLHAARTNQRPPHASAAREAGSAFSRQAGDEP